MAHTVSGATLAPILDNLNGLANYHPFDAETFSDWAIQAGDIVTMTRDGKTYQSPVHTATTTWRGKAPTVTVNSSGKQKRDPVSKVSRRKYGGGGAGMRNNQGLYYEIHDESGLLHTEIAATEQYVTLSVSEERSRAEGAESSISSQLSIVAGNIAAEVTDRQNGDDYLSGLLDIVSDKVSLIVTQKDGEDVIDIASIVVGINSQTGSYVRIAASSINLDGYVKATDITTDYLAAKIADIPTLRAQTISAADYLVANGSGMGSISLKNAYTNARIQQNGNTYTLQMARANTGQFEDIGSFSRATSLSGAWSGNTYTVTATPQGNTHDVAVQTRFGAANGMYYLEAYQSNSPGATSITDTSKTYKLGLSGTTVQVQSTGGTQYGSTPTLPLDPFLQEKTVNEDGDVLPDDGYIGLRKVTISTGGGGNVTITGSWSGTTYTAYAQVNGSTVATTNTNISLLAQGGGTSTFSVLATTVGAGGGTGDVHASKTVAMSLSGSGSNATVLGKFDGTTYGQLNVGSLYTAGMSAGESKFTPVVVTMQGAQASAAYVESSGLGTYYYPSTGTTKYDRGSSVSVFPAQSPVYFSTVTRYAPGTSGTYYTAGATQTYYTAGTVTKTDRGETVTVTPVGAGVVLSQETRYKIGTSGTDYVAGTAKTYYNAGTTTKYDRGNTVSVVPIGTTSLRLSAATRYTLGASGTYYAAGTAKTYYNAGTTTKIDRGTAVSVTPINGATRFSAVTRYTLGTAGTYYTAGTAATYYKGDGGTYVARGDSVSVTPIGTSKYFYQYNGGTKISLYKADGTSAGNRFWFYATTTGGGAFYNKGTAATYYKGNGGNVVARGTSVSVTPIGTSYTRYTLGTSGTYYQVVSSGGTAYWGAGTTTTYYKGDGGTFTVQGTSVSVTPIGTSYTRYTAGTAATVYITHESGTYYYVSGTAATYYKGDGGAFTVQGTSVSVTPIGTSYTRYTLGTSETVYVTVSSGTTYHKAGTPVTYYKGNGGTFTVQGGSVSVTPVGSSYTRWTQGASATYYALAPESQATVTYFSAGSARTYYEGNGGAFTPIDTSNAKHLQLAVLYSAGSSSTYYQKTS